MRCALSFALVLPIALSALACSGGTPPADAPQTDAASSQPAIPQGMPVYVNRSGQWLPATIVRQTGPASVLVHYEGAPAEYDEDVPFDRVRSRPEAAAAAAPSEYKSGETVLVSAQNRMYLAEVRQQIDANTYRVRFSGYGPETVDNVTADRLQRPFTGVTAFPVGTPVQVIAGGPQTYPGKVIAAVRQDQWIVRLDNAGPEYDQIVGPDRIRPLAPSAAPAATPAPAAPAATAAAAPATATPAPAASAAASAAKAPEAAPAPLKSGDAVLVQTRGIYHPGKVVGPGAAQGAMRVRVDGQGADEEVPQKQLTRLEDPLKGVKYKAGQDVFIEWHGVYAPGKVIKEADAGNYKVRPEGKGAEADEIVPVRRLRPRK
jgi:hypothetical protein